MKDIKCAMCERPATEIHHIFNGWGMRKLCDQDGLTIPVCADCHRRIHADAEIRKFWKMHGQALFEQEHSHDEFMKRYGKNYLPQ